MYMQIYIYKIYTYTLCISVHNFINHQKEVYRKMNKKLHRVRNINEK